MRAGACVALAPAARRASRPGLAGPAANAGIGCLRLVQTSRRSVFSAAASSGAGPPGGYWRPRLAVGVASTVGAVALYELISRALGGRTDADDADYAEWDEAWDKPIDPELHPALAMALRLRQATDARVGRRSLVFVRHAQPAQEGKAGLSDVGQRQAEIAAQRLGQLFGNADVVYHSSAPPAKATAECFKRNLQGSRRLVETALLDEGLPLVPSPAPPGLAASAGEDEMLADLTRAEAALCGLVWRPTGEDRDRGSVEVIVTHGNVIRYLTCRALQLPPAAWSRMKANHCAFTWIEVDSDGAVALREFGGVGHLPAELLTYH